MNNYRHKKPLAQHSVTYAVSCQRNVYSNNLAAQFINIVKSLFWEV